MPLPPYHPEGTETIQDIPARFLVDGYLKLRADGAWLFRGEKIKHHGLQKFLSRQLRLTEEGQYWVVNGPQRALVEIEDTPYLVTRIAWQKDDQASPMLATLNDSSEEELLPESLFMSEEGVLYTHVKRGQAGASESQSHRARISANALLDIEALLVETDNDGIAIQYKGKMYPLTSP